MIWDLHCHLAGFEGRTPDEKMVELIRYADRMGIDRVCVYMGYPFDYDPKPETLRAQNDQVLQALSHWHHRAFGFVYLNPRYLQASLDELNRCVRDGPMVGVKLWVAVRANAPELDRIIERAAALKAVIFQHTWIKTGGNLPGESTSMDLGQLAQRHPEVKIICGHTGGNWELGIRAIRGNKNLYSDLAGSDPTSGYVEMAVRELGPERVIYGSDVGGRSFASQLGKVMGAAIPQAARDRILATNLQGLMMPILQAKGVRL
jgi:predicted TIM-barrel fold metal-dependent hydrolase